LSSRAGVRYIGPMLNHAFDWITDPQAWIALATLTALELVLGIDNIIFIAILAGKLPEAQQDRARKTGLGVAMITRLCLLFSLTWIMGLTKPFFSVFGHDVSGRDLILIAGGLFLMAKSTLEIHDKLEGAEEHQRGGKAASFTGVVLQIAVLDIVFSLDSVITAVGLAKDLVVMSLAIVLAVAFMMVFVGALNRFVERHPTVKLLALSFLLLVGLTLVADGGGVHVPKGYIYFAMAFSAFVEGLNIRLRKASAPPVRLHEPHLDEETGEKN
jgi:predicted tellurium resistance membrane protein TerC